MTKQERNRINREMREKAMKAWELATNASYQISLPYEIEALDAMIAKLQEIRQFKAELLGKMNKR